MKAQGRLARQWQVLSAISKTRDGLTLAKLMDVTGQSRPTVYRDLQVLEEAGLPLTRDKGRVRLLTDKELPPNGFNAMQIASLHFARLQLAPLAGAGFVRELDGLLEELRPVEAQSTFRFASSGKPIAPPGVLKTIEQAQRYRRRVTIEYRAATRAGEPTRVDIEPLVFNVADGEPYVLAYCVQRKGERTYKLARISSAELTVEGATYKPSQAPAEAFTHAVKAWSGKPQLVRIALDSSVAWLAREHPLPNQKLVSRADGSVVVEARVAGLVEVSRWVLAWGGAAEALEPRELREAARAELARALQKYDGPGPKKAVRATKRKSTEPRAASLRHAETRAG